MAPATLYDRPNVQLVHLLRAARDHGQSFESAWQEAMRPDKSIVMSTTHDAPMGALRWPTDRYDRDAWRWALGASKEGWRRAYELAPPSPQEAAVVWLAEMLGGLEDASTVAVPVSARGMGALQAVA